MKHKLNVKWLILKPKPKEKINIEIGFKWNEN